MSTANESPSPGAFINTPDRDHAADSDDSLARKRQRFSEEREVRIEADEPEDLGDDLGNAIMIEDDLETNAYSDSFQVLGTKFETTATEELKQLQRVVAGNVFFDTPVFAKFVTWIDEHLEDTEHDKRRWQFNYLKDEPFFTELAAFAHSVLDCPDLFDPNISPPIIRELATRFFDALTRLCLRIVSFIPNLLEEPFMRRDSVQPAAAGQGLPLSTYISLLATLLNDRIAFSLMLQRQFGVRPLAGASRNAKLVLERKTTIPSLNRILLTLSIQPRSFNDAWPVISDVIHVLAVAFRSADIAYHAGDGLKHVDDMFMAINEYVVPAVCQKHPRALPPGFHEHLTVHMAAVLEHSVTHRSMSSVLEAYHAITRVDNALPCGIVDEPATESKLSDACGGDRRILAELLRDLWLLQVLKGYVSTDILDIKSKGILSLRQLLKDSYHAYHKNGGDEHTVLQYLARFLRIGNFTEYIFSADSHASLVKECSDVVGFLAAIGTYTNHETDLIWSACSTSVEAEFVKASFEVLRNILTYVRPPQVLHMARKYSQTPASALGPFAVHFLSDVFAKFHATNVSADLSLEPLRISFDIVKRCDSDPAAASTSSLRCAAVHEISLLNDTSYGIDERKILYDMCFQEIRNRTRHATSSMQILFLFMKPSNAEDVELILDLFPVKAAVDELEHFVSSSTRDQKIGAHTMLEAVKVRLQLVLYLIGLDGFTEDKELEERLWACAIGDAAFSSQAREVALDCFISTPQLTRNPSSVGKLFHRGVDQFLPTMSADCATLGLVAFLQGKVKEADTVATLENIESILKDQSWQQLTRLATTTSSDIVAAAGISAINEVLFPKYILRDSPQVVSRQAAFVRGHIDFLQSLQDEKDASIRQNSIDRGISLLETVHHHSKAFKPQVVGDVHPIELAGNEESDRIEFKVHIHGPQGSPIERTVKALQDCHIVDLGKALQSTSGVADHDLVLNGSLSRLEDISDQTLHEAGIKASSVVSIRPRYTFDCDFEKVFASTSPVESEIRAKFQHLESLLDGPEVVAERVYNFLSGVSPPMSTRRHVLSHDVSLEVVFPHGRLWRTMYSINVLSSHLRECNKLGVADQAFILHGAKLLSDLLLDSSRPLSGVVLLKCFPSLVGFLQGEIEQPKLSTSLRVANIPTERPQNSPPPPYIGEPTKLGLRLFEIIEKLEHISAPSMLTSSQQALAMRADLAKLAYAVVLQLARTDGLWPGIDKSDAFTSAHKTLLLCNDPSISQSMSAIMADFVKEKPELATRSYMNTLLALLPDALSQHCSTSGFFVLFREVLLVDRRASDNDASIRSIIDKLVWHLWRYRHIETADNAVLDSTFWNLLSLLNCAIDILKSFKKPLSLGTLAMDLHSRLLFCDPPRTQAGSALEDSVEVPTANLALRSNLNQVDSTAATRQAVQAVPEISVGQNVPRPLYHIHSRAVCLEIVRKLCDNAEALAWLIDRATSVTHQVSRCPVGAFPTGTFIRGPDASSGLTNLGMTCYMNSLLQQIYSNIEFRKFIFDIPVLHSSEPDLIGHVKHLFAEMQDSNLPCVDTQALAKYLNISVENQEDVHGFYTIFMSALEQCLPDPAATAAFNRMFSGKLVTQVQGSCGHVSARTEPFSDLSITVQNKTSLADSLDEFVQGEPMQGANKYKCLSCDAENGGKLVDAMRRTCLETVPDHLTVCLKRFTFDMMGQESKNNDFFQFPEQIDLAKYKRDSLENTEEPVQPDFFKLVGVIVHSGILTFGHYWSYVRQRYPDHRISEWVRLEDNHFRPARGFEEIRNECFGGSNRTHNGYVLFYQREASFETAASAIKSQDGLMGYRLPPRVQLPDELYQEIHQQNVERYRTAQPFDDSFHKLAMDIIHEYRAHESGGVDSASPTTPDATQSRDEQLVILDRLQLHTSLARFAFEYITRVLLSERVHPKLLQFVTAFKNLACVDTRLARSFIEEVCGDPEIFLRIIDHDECDSRHVLKMLLRDCLAAIRDDNSDGYFGLLVQYVTAHASLLPRISTRYHRWFDYFSMPFDVKMFGADESFVVLNAGYFEWILETAVDIPCNPSRHPDQQYLIHAAKKGKASYLPLFHFVQLFLMSGGAFDNLDSFDDFGHDGKYKAARALVQHRRDTRNPRFDWMFLASFTEFNGLTWDQFAPANLVRAMASSPDSRFRPLLAQSLVSCFQNNQDYRPALFMMTTGFIIACGDECPVPVSSVLSAMVEGVKQFERPPCKLAFEVFDTVIPSAPLAVLRSMGAWAPEWLLPEHGNSKRTTNWLRTRVFTMEPVNTDPEHPTVWGTAVDVARSRSVRTVFEGCRHHLLEAHEVDDTGAFPQMQIVLHDMAEYFDRLLKTCSDMLQIQHLQRSENGTEEAEESIVYEDEVAEPESSNTNDIPVLSNQMAEEMRLAVRVRQDLLALRQQLQSWNEEQEPLEEEGESSAFDESEDDDL